MPCGTFLCPPFIMSTTTVSGSVHNHCFLLRYNHRLHPQSSFPSTTIVHRHQLRSLSSTFSSLFTTINYRLFPQPYLRLCPPLSHLCQPSTTVFVFLHHRIHLCLLPSSSILSSSTIALSIDHPLSSPTTISISIHNLLHLY